jgi:hypothetical protein
VREDAEFETATQRNPKVKVWLAREARIECRFERLSSRES